MTLLLEHGDRTCEECAGKGVVPEDEEDGYGNTYEIAVACEWCEDGKITERQNPKKPIDWTYWNELGRELAIHDRRIETAKRRGCWNRGQMTMRFTLYSTWEPDIKRWLCVGYYPTILPSGPVILLPPSPIGVGSTIANLEWRNAPRALAI